MSKKTLRIGSTVLQLLALTVLWVANPSSACTLAEYLSDSDQRLVIIGQIRDYQAVSDQSEDSYGIVVDALAEFDHIGIDTDQLVFLPRAGLGADCTSHYFKNVRQLEARFPLESLITIVYDLNFEPTDEPSVIRGADLRVLGRECNLEDVADERRVYSVRDNSCSSNMFQGAKDIAKLQMSNQEMRVATLMRLAEFPNHVYFEELVDKYVSDPADKVALMTTRYADAIERGCAKWPDTAEYSDPGYFQRRQIRARWFEYCTDERKEVAQQK